MINFPLVYQHYSNAEEVNDNPQMELQFFVHDTRDGFHFRVPAPWEDPEQGLKYLNRKCVEYLEDAKKYQKWIDNRNNKRGNGNEKVGIAKFLDGLFNGSRIRGLSNGQRMS